MGKGRGKKLAAELLLKAIATTKLKPLFAESLNSMVPVKQKDSPIV
jgi:proteasome assembly chaperone (PAC2) family protein